MTVMIRVSGRYLQSNGNTCYVEDFIYYSIILELLAFRRDVSQRTFTDESISETLASARYPPLGCKHAQTVHIPGKAATEELWTSWRLRSDNKKLIRKTS